MREELRIDEIREMSAAKIRSIICGLSALTFQSNNIIQITETVTFIVFYARGTLSVKTREEHKLRILENMLLRKIFELKKDEVIGDGRKLHELCPS